jgi:hypothetical protein
MQQVTEQQAIEKAQAFIVERRAKYPCGALQGVRHKAVDDRTKRYTGKTSGTYYVEFAYAGPKVKGHSVPAQDHPTVVLVDDESGECSVMMWM